MHDPALWKRLEQTPLIRASEHEAFLAQLQAHFAWPRFRAEGAMREYRRYLYLSKVAEGHIQPGPVLNALHQLHMQHAPDFWAAAGLAAPDGNQILTLQSSAQERIACADTLARYQFEFGLPAPAEFWPPALRKPARKSRSRGFLMLMAGGFAAFIAGFFTGYFAVSALGFFFFFGAAHAWVASETPGLHVPGNKGVGGFLGSFWGGGGGGIGGS